MPGEVKLLPCPFCGGEAKLYTTTDDGTGSDYMVECESCYVTGKVCESEQEAIAAWNRRTPSERREDGKA